MYSHSWSDCYFQRKGRISSSNRNILVLHTFIAWQKLKMRGKNRNIVVKLRLIITEIIHKTSTFTTNNKNLRIF